MNKKKIFKNVKLSLCQVRLAYFALLFNEFRTGGMIIMLVGSNKFKGSNFVKRGLRETLFLSKSGIAILSISSVDLLMMNGRK